jgi:hypothetical protein
MTFTFLGFGNISLLGLSFLIVYYRIEIQHPIYSVLFCDLCVTLFFAAIDMVALFTLDLEGFKRVAGPSGLLCMYFLSSSWFVVAVLR